MCVNSLGGIRICVAKIVCFAELVQPVGDAVGMHYSTIILRENESGVLPDVAVNKSAFGVLIIAWADSLNLNAYGICSSLYIE